MSFDPQLFLNIAEELKAGNTEAHYRSIINRSYYAAFGVLQVKLNFTDTGLSAHQNMYKDLQASVNGNHRKIGKRLEQIFERRKDADYKYSTKIESSAVEFSINTARYIIDNL
jgi:uncharacterized protein (UPF0332 family)